MNKIIGKLTEGTPNEDYIYQKKWQNLSSEGKSFLVMIYEWIVNGKYPNNMPLWSYRQEATRRMKYKNSELIKELEKELMTNSLLEPNGDENPRLTQTGYNVANYAYKNSLIF